MMNEEQWEAARLQLVSAVLGGMCANSATHETLVYSTTAIAIADETLRKMYSGKMPPAQAAIETYREALVAEIVVKLESRIYGGDARHGVYNAGINDAIEIVKEAGKP